MIPSHSDDDGVAAEYEGFVLADGRSVPLNKQPLSAILLDLLAAYYSWGLSFPKQYQILGFMQQHYIGDLKAKCHKGTAYVRLEKRYRQQPEPTD